jgi:hypothetical protein
MTDPCSGFSHVVRAGSWREALDILREERGLPIVRVSCLVLTEPALLGKVETSVLLDLVYFKDAAGDELGYYCKPSRSACVFTTPRKVGAHCEENEMDIWTLNE